MGCCCRKESKPKDGNLTKPLELQKAAHGNTLIFFYGPTLEDKATYQLINANLILQHPKFDNSKKTTIYLHGYNDKMEDTSLRVTIEAYLKRNDHNLLVLDWHNDAKGNYCFTVLKKMNQVGNTMATVIISLIYAGLKLENLHLVGHSLGGQMAGVIGREVIKQSDGKFTLKRLSALDPAFPGFYPAKCAFVKPISQNDAEFVDVIHTDPWLYGAPSSTGTADFWPNIDKTFQPGCPKRNYLPLSDNDLCSHRRSWWFWAESVIDKYPQKFNSIRAKSWKDFKAGKVLGTDTNYIVMGLHCSPDAMGDYYLQTNCTSPYARGKDGTIYRCDRSKK